MKHNPNATANALAVTVTASYVVCRVAVMLMPNFAMSVARSWFHGMQLSSSWNLSSSSFILGLVISAGLGWLLGYMFAVTYNYFAKK